MSKPKHLGYPNGATPSLHLDRGDGTPRCGVNSIAVKKRDKLKDEDFNWLCGICSKLSLADAMKESEDLR